MGPMKSDVRKTKRFCRRLIADSQQVTLFIVCVFIINGFMAKITEYQNTTYVNNNIRNADCQISLFKYRESPKTHIYSLAMYFPGYSGAPASIKYSITGLIKLCKKSKSQSFDFELNTSPQFLITPA